MPYSHARLPEHMTPELGSAIHWTKVSTTSSYYSAAQVSTRSADIRDKETVRELHAGHQLAQLPPSNGIVGSPEYFESHLRPETPHDLLRHRCINFRHGSGRVYRWELDKDEKSVAVSVNGALIVDDVELLIRAAVDGVGLAFVSESHAEPYLAAGSSLRRERFWRRGATPESSMSPNRPITSGSCSRSSRSLPRRTPRG